MDADLGQLDDLVARLRRLDGCGAAIAEEALPELLEEVRRTADAGTTPEGEAWAPTKADARRALPNAAAAISAVVSGTTRAVITLILRGKYVFHHAMRGKGRRRILPTPADGLPPRYAEILRKAAGVVAARTLRGGR